MKRYGDEEGLKMHQAKSAENQVEWGNWEGEGGGGAKMKVA